MRYDLGITHEISVFKVESFAGLFINHLFQKPKNTFGMNQHILYTGFLILISAGCIDNQNGDSLLETGCLFEDFYYYQGEQNVIGDLSSEFILVGSDTTKSDQELLAVVNSYDQFEKADTSDFRKYDQYRYQHLILRLSSPENCPTVSAIIEDLKLNHSVIDYVHFTFQTDDCTDLVGERIGDRCVDSYSSLFYVKVKDTDDMTDLENTVSVTDTQIRSQNQFREEWFTLFADKSSSEGDALRMANYFFETGLFEASEPDIIKLAVE